MGDAYANRQRAQALPEGDVIRVLLEQHAWIRDLFDEVTDASGRQRREAFEELRGLLAIHEAAEQIVLRPVSRAIAGDDVADARAAEERRIAELVRRLEQVDVGKQQFLQELADLRHLVDQHAESEERDEFAAVLEQCDESQRRRMGQRLLAVEKVAPARPDPADAEKPASEQWVVEPFVTFVNRVREILDRNP